ncbi:MAG: hypothetical protein K0U86_06360, partial [Planctomycetes bacterium]|nr:hypothetical protein [Planctomycetota bacterium]MCH9776316.1 hypothetical protein [Planctomycetota bacterium]
PPLLQKSELSTTKSLTHKSVGDHLGATLLIQFTTSRQALRFLAGVYNLFRIMQQEDRVMFFACGSHQVLNTKY